MTSGSRREGVHYDSHVDKLPAAGRAKVRVVHPRGSQVMDGTILDMIRVWISTGPADLSTMFRHLDTTRITPENSSNDGRQTSIYGIHKVIQGARTGRFLGRTQESGWKTRSLSSIRAIHGQWSTITLEDYQWQQKILKEQMDLKIDSVAALMDAWVAYKTNSTTSITRGCYG